MESPSKPRIVALGGGASKVVDRLVREGAVDADFIALNADAQDLKRSLAPTKLLLGAKTTRGLGAGGDDELGREVVLADQPLVEAALAGAQRVIVVACLGGGTGSGGASLVCTFARDAGAEVCAVVAMPFPFEGRRRRRIAEQALGGLREALGPACVLVGVEIEEGLPMQRAFAALDERMADAVRARLTAG